MRFRPPVARMVVAASLLLAACAPTSSPPSVTVPVSDPTSTRDLAGAGAGSIRPIALDDLPAISTAAIEATIVDVQPSRANTPDGAFPDIDPSLGPEQLRSLYPMTDIDIRVDVVYGDRAELEGALQPGMPATITVFGGHVATTLTPDEARALGVLVTPDEVAPDADSGIDADAEIEVDPTGPVPFSLGVAPDVTLTEGDRVLLFLTERAMAGFDGAAPFERISIAHPFGVFRRDASGRWRSDLIDTEEIDIEALARAVDDR